jgi:D-alanyl-D-alanine carboxypeptidase
MKKFLHGKYLVLFFLLIVFFNGTVLAETFDINGDGKTGIHEAIYALKTAAGHEPSVEEKVQQLLDKTCEEFGLPGISMAIIKENQEVVYFLSGESDKINETKMTPEAQFRIGSITKTFTGMTIMQLAQEGKLFLTQTVEYWLPGLVPTPPDPEPANYTGYNANNITIRHLLMHTSGLENFTNDDDFLDNYYHHLDQAYTPQEIIAIAVSHDPVAQPDEVWYYSNTNYVLLGMIVEQATGHTWEDEVRSRFIDVLGLTDTFIPETGQTGFFGEFAHGYMDLEERFPPHEISGILSEFTYREPSQVDSSGNMIATPDNLARWIKAIAEGELFNEQYQDLLLNDKVDINGYINMGLGVVHDVYNGFMQHPGQISGYDCGAFYHMDSHVSLGMCTNRTIIQGIKIHQLILYDIMNILYPPEEEPPAKKARRFVEPNGTHGGRLTEY